MSYHNSGLKNCLASKNPVIICMNKYFRGKGILIGVSTSRREQDALSFIEELQPDILITSGGALIKYKNAHIYRAEFSGEETGQMIAIAREVCGMDCGIIIDAIDSYCCNIRSIRKSRGKVGVKA